MSTPRPPAPGPLQGPPAAPITAKQRLRVRKLVRRGLMGVIAVQVLAFAAITTPRADAVIPVFDWRALFQDGLAYFQDYLNLEEQFTSNALTTRLRDVADQHLKGIGQYGGYVTGNIDVDGVSQRPIEYAMTHRAHRVTIPGAGPLQPDRETHFGYTNADASNDMRALMPVDAPWRSYQDEYLASAEGAAQTLRGSVAALNALHVDMQDDNRRFTDLRNQAGRVDSDIAMAQVQVEGQLELARQIQRANAINSLQANIYAVVENQRISAEARSIAQDQKSSCEILAMLGGGAVGGIVGQVIAGNVC